MPDRHTASAFAGASGQEDNVVTSLFAPEMKAQEAVRRKTGLEGELLRVAAHNLLQSDDGLRLICAVLDETGVFTSSFTGNSATFFLEGKRHVGLYLYQLLMSADPYAMQRLIDYRRVQAQGDTHD